MNRLYLSLNEAGLMLEGHIDQGGVNFIVLETYEDGTIHSVDVNTFETLFGISYFYFGRYAYTMTADEMSYQKYFDLWKAQGII